MIIVGLTGGIGSGKSTIAEFFSELGVPVYVADTEAKNLMNTSKIIQKKIIAEFGANAYSDDNLLNRKYLATIVFNDKSKLAAINNIVHPKLAKHFSKWLKKQKGPYAIQENAIIFENNTADRFDYVITVTAPVEQRIERVINRDASTKSDVVARMKNQWKETKKNKLADFVIHNINLSDTKKQAKIIHKKIKKLIIDKKILK